jgi:hypothetical protein
LWSLGLECLVALLSVFSHLLFSFFFLEIRELIKFFLSNYMLLKIFFPIVIMFIFFLLLLLIFFTGSAGTISILKKIQNGVVLVKNKNKSQRVATGFLTEILPGQPAGSAGSWFFLFFLQPGPIPIPDRPVRLDWISKLYFLKYHSNIHSIFLAVLFLFVLISYFF